jgi:hypothetical protein
MRVNIVEKDAPFRLAALECAASCIVSALDIRGLDRRLFLMGYWHTVYFEGLLMSAQNIKWIELAYEYGIQTRMTSGPSSEVAALLERGDMAIVLCRASELRFFPASMLGFESTGFYHCVLAYGKGEAENSFLVTDSVAGFRGDMTTEELDLAGVRREEWVYCHLSFNASYRQPELRTSFLRETNRILDEYGSDGRSAIDSFLGVLAESGQWDPVKRRSWADRNNIALAALSKMRTIVWQSYLDTGLLDAEERETGSRLAEKIVRGWTNVNLQLVRYGISGVPRSSESIRSGIEEVVAAELLLLKLLAGSGREPE